MSEQFYYDQTEADYKAYFGDEREPQQEPEELEFDDDSE